MSWVFGCGGGGGGAVCCIDRAKYFWAQSVVLVVYSIGVRVQ